MAFTGNLNTDHAQSFVDSPTRVDGTATEVVLSGGTLLSEGNTSTTPLGPGETFTGTGEQNIFPQVGVSVKTDNSGVLYFDFSNDGTNWDSTFPVSGFVVSSGVHEFHTAVKLGRYFRVRLVNDSGAQSYLRLYTYYGYNYIPSNHPYNQSIGIDTDAITTRPSNFGDEVLIGRRTGVTHFTKFGYRTGLTAANGEETIWAASGNFTPLTTASTMTITYNNTLDGSTANGAKTLYIQYVDENGLDAVLNHTLGSTGNDVTSVQTLGINRIAVSSSGSTQTNGADITVTATTGGTIQAFVPAGQGVTQQCVFHVDSNSDAVAKFLWINTNKLSGSNPKLTIKGYVFNRPVATRFEVFRLTVDTSAENTVAIEEPIGFKLSPGDVLYFVADTDTNNALVNLRFSLFEYKRT